MKRRVLVFGTFDILHPGHLYFLKHAKQYGDELVVIVTRDETVKKLKGRLPYFTEQERLTMLRALKFVSGAHLGDKHGKWTMIAKWKPRVICVGHDQVKSHPNIQSQLSKFKRKPIIIQLRAFKRQRYRSSKIYDRP